MQFLQLKLSDIFALKYHFVAFTKNPQILGFSGLTTPNMFCCNYMNLSTSKPVKKYGLVELMKLLIVISFALRASHYMKNYYLTLIHVPVICNFLSHYMQ